MTVIPNFIVKKLYVTGSLRFVPEGIAFDLSNKIGPGILTKINSIKLSDVEFLANQICLKLEDKLIQAVEVSENNPVTCFLNQTVTCILQGNSSFTPGNHTITLDLFSKEAGKIVISIQDKLVGEPA
ncbi:MAG: hypothetical protein K2X66_05470 [Cyanobacteria bacterium]|nr:hypothetical protein [Cyanobacteriota bacterium]